ncbi:hypothetical protein [Streptosporangium sp. NPDC051022]|uniref:hypothetical protein n=1 Tax=Streptosporangium sp. NPDC051022 TaxID=3155752 RepID=UPI0034219911
MSESLDALERRIAELRAEVRRAVSARENSLARSLRGDLRRAEQAWDEAITAEEPSRPLQEPETSLLPIREQVHQALALLGVPAAAKLVVAVNEAFFSRALRGPQLTSLRRDEERSFRSAPYARPYYLCAALTDRLSPARGLLADSTWEPERRVLGPLSPRVDFLLSTMRVAEHLTRLAEPSAGALRLLSRMAHNIPGAVEGLVPADPETAIRAAGAELEVHLAADAAQRAEVAARAAGQLSDVERLFGAAAMSTVMSTVTSSVRMSTMRGAC